MDSNPQISSNEKGNYFESETACLIAMFPLLSNLQSREYCEPCDTFCLNCPRKGQWIKIDSDVIEADKACYCHMTPCQIFVPTLPSKSNKCASSFGTGRKCPGFAMKDGRGKCIDLDHLFKTHQPEASNLSRSEASKSSFNTLDTLIIFACFTLLLLAGKF